jgi:hypothetical protein
MAMTDMSTSPVVHREVANRAGGGMAPRCAAGWLGLAAAPTFALMAVWTAFFSGQADMVCVALPSASPLSGMTWMYLLMSAFNWAPWLRQFSRKPNEAEDS